MLKQLLLIIITLFILFFNSFFNFNFINALISSFVFTLDLVLTSINELFK